MSKGFGRWKSPIKSSHNSVFALWSGRVEGQREEVFSFVLAVLWLVHLGRHAGPFSNPVHSETVFETEAVVVVVADVLTGVSDERVFLGVLFRNSAQLPPPKASPCSQLASPSEIMLLHMTVSQLVDTTDATVSFEQPFPPNPRRLGRHEGPILTFLLSPEMT